MSPVSLARTSVRVARMRTGAVCDGVLVRGFGMQKCGYAIQKKGSDSGKVVLSSVKL
jgi:hypothetical protein